MLPQKLRGKESACNAENGETWVPFVGLEYSLEDGMVTHSFSCLENPMDRGDWWASLYGHKHSETTEATNHTKAELAHKRWVDLPQIGIWFIKSVLLVWLMGDCHKKLFSILMMIN